MMNNLIELQSFKGEARVDSRVIARELGIQSGNLLETVYKYRQKIERFGILTFQTGKIGRRGRPERYALLNEDQAHFVMALSRNTERVRIRLARFTRSIWLASIFSLFYGRRNLLILNRFIVSVHRRQKPEKRPKSAVWAV
jgi:hypothetical protein